MKHSLLFLALLAGGAALGYLPHALSRAAVSAPAEEAAAVPSSPPRADEEVWISATGRVEPCSGLRRLVFKTEGVVGRCLVQPGSRVSKGDVLLVLDNHQEQAAVELAQASLKQARAEWAKALSGAHPEEIAAAQNNVQVIREQVRHFRTELERSRKSFAHAAISQQEYAQSWTAWAQKAVGQMSAEADLRRLQQQVRPEDKDLADAKVGQAEAELRVAQRRLEDSYLRAPGDGTVLEVLKREGEGQRLMDNEPAVVFADLEQLCVRADVEPQQAVRLAVGQEVRVSGRGLAGKSVNGRVAAVKQVLGAGGVWGRTRGERPERDVLQVLIEVDSGFWAPVGLPVEVKIHVAP
jgi:HlyD family secretion protein